MISFLALRTITAFFFMSGFSSHSRRGDFQFSSSSYLPDLGVAILLIRLLVEPLRFENCVRWNTAACLFAEHGLNVSAKSSNLLFCV